MHWDLEPFPIASSALRAASSPPEGEDAMMSSVFGARFQICTVWIGTVNLWIARQRLGLRQSSGAFGWLASIAKVPED